MRDTPLDPSLRWEDGEGREDGNRPICTKMTPFEPNFKNCSKIRPSE